MSIDHAHYDEKLAGVYDQMYPVTADTEQAVALIADLAPPGGRVLELGVGTGRIALPLAERGFEVHGIDGSEAMLAKLKEQDAKGAVSTVLGDFTERSTGLRFDVITVVMNTFFSAITQEQQLGCLRNAADQLAPGGRFILEAFDPAVYHTMEKQELSMQPLGENGVLLNTLTVDRSQQIMLGTHTILDGGPPETKRHLLRYAFPFELDLLAKLSGLRLVERWEDWTRQPYTFRSTRHVSVYEADTGESAGSTPCTG
ncbi:class I SAM-dependent methyltransferase [Streptomyces sp. Edi2]|uniref:class I SAM-dependent methyltransferase n=1 Tax=Streptomyces sp. Edi2 TaxID=3162528 RepID=UPI003305A9CA